ncbi:MAG: hypothetical protein AUK48_00695 [Oscillatoriales cyanobacterium CG2_30_44_21]|nr:MAG: hypothetical protein AUK48_00695 [Oscillatoriales cyanobacterium CG2_30_44_21]
MSQYQRIEYLIGKDGKVVERAVDMGSECVAVTSEIESSLGKVVSRDLLPSFYDRHEQSIDCNTVELAQYEQSP